MSAPKTITVSVSGPAHVAEIVKREVAKALSDLGAFEVTAEGDFFNGSGQSCDPERMELLTALARDGEFRVYVRRRA